MAIPLIKIENARGEVLDLSADPRYQPILRNAGPPAATINRSKVAGAPGSRYNSGAVNERNLLLTVILLQDIARARLNLYRFLCPNEYVKIYYEADGLDVYIEGYAETVEVDPWTQEEAVAASIICPQPFWSDLAETYTDASVVTSLFEFPFAITAAGVELSTVDHNASTIIYNEGTVETGVTFVLRATLRSTQPRIYNLNTGKYIGFYADMQPGDMLVINTNHGRKSVTHIREGVETNYINTLMEDSDWLQMAVGANEYIYTVDEGEMQLGIYHTNRYIGV